MKEQKKSSELEKRKKPENEADIKKEIGGRKGPEPTRFGDWENNGKCVDF